MHSSPAWRRYLHFWRPDVEGDVDDELRFHFETRIEELTAQGAAPAQARARALEEFGDVARVRDGLRAIDRRIAERRGRAERWAVLAQEIRYGLRRLARQPGFTLPALLTLALGIGATAAVFTLLDAVVLRPLPYAGADRLVRFWSDVPGVGEGMRWGMAKAEFLYFRRDTRAFADMALYQVGSTTLGTPGAGEQAEYVQTATVSASMHAVLGARVAIGRGLTARDNLSDPPAVALLAHDYWQRRFGGDPGVVGRTVTLGGTPVQVAGVLAPGVALPDELMGGAGRTRVQLWLPLALDPAEPPAASHRFRALGRLRPGVSLAAARADAARLTAGLPRALPGTYTQRFLEGTRFTTLVVPLRDDVLGGIGRVLWTLLGAVVLLLCIAGANVLSLYFARLEMRRRETAVRAALGAGRGEIARHFLCETVPLALAAGAAAAGIAALGIRLLVAAAPTGIPRLREVRLGWPELLATAAVSLAIGVGFGLLPLARRDAATTVLGEAGRGAVTSRRQQAVRNALVVAQVALSLVLLAGAGLLVQSFRRLGRVHAGLDPRGVVTMRVVPPEARYDSAATVAAFYDRLAERVAALPGVESVGFTSYLPFTGDFGCSSVVAEDRAPGAGEEAPCISAVTVAPGYFRALGIPVRGRAPTWDDLRRGAPLAVVSEAFARRAWPGQDPLGKGLRPGSRRTERFTVVGVAGDVRAAGLDQPPSDGVYLLPVASLRPVIGLTRSMTLVVRASSRSARSAAALVPAIRRAAAEVDPDVPITAVRAMDEVLASSMARRAFAMRLLAVASAMALVLSVIGIYGVVSYLVARRRSEIGIRMALGARGAQVRRLVVLQSVRLAATGVAFGVAGALLATRLLRSLLFEVSPTDPLTLALVSALLVALAALASDAPARRAMRVDPVEALRHE